MPEGCSGISSGYSAIAPDEGVSFPALNAAFSVNQTLPSGATAIDEWPKPFCTFAVASLVGSAYDVNAPDALTWTIALSMDVPSAFAWLSMNHTLLSRSAASAHT